MTVLCNKKRCLHCASDMIHSYPMSKKLVIWSECAQYFWKLSFLYCRLAESSTWSTSIEMVFKLPPKYLSVNCLDQFLALIFSILAANGNALNMLGYSKERIHIKIAHETQLEMLRRQMFQIMLLCRNLTMCSDQEDMSFSAEMPSPIFCILYFVYSLVPGPALRT